MKVYIYIITAIVVVGLASWILIPAKHQKEHQQNSGSSVSTENYLTPAINGNYKQAEADLQNKLTGNPDTTTKLEIYLKQSVLATNTHHYADATRYADEAKKLSPNDPTAYVAFAQIATAEGNKSQAIGYWQQAIRMLNANQPGYNIIAEDYQANIKALQ